MWTFASGASSAIINQYEYSTRSTDLSVQHSVQQLCTVLAPHHPGTIVRVPPEALPACWVGRIQSGCFFHLPRQLALTGPHAACAPAPAPTSPRWGAKRNTEKRTAQKRPATTTQVPVLPPPYHTRGHWRIRQVPILVRYPPYQSTGTLGLLVQSFLPLPPPAKTPTNTPHTPLPPSTTRYHY